jgi:hypothetical protein
MCRPLKERGQIKLPGSGFNLVRAALPFRCAEGLAFPQTHLSEHLLAGRSLASKCGLGPDRKGVAFPHNGAAEPRTSSSASSN